MTNRDRTPATFLKLTPKLPALPLQTINQTKRNSIRSKRRTTLNTERIKNLHTILASKSITPIYVQFGIDPKWLVTDNKIKKSFVGSYVNELAQYWTAHVVWMKKNGVTPKYIELFNEPDYHDEEGNGNG